MSATAIQAPTRQVVSEKEWITLFPKQVTENYTSSVTFIKQLTVVALSTITYCKNALPEESYNSEMFAGLKMKLLKVKCADDMAQFVSSSMKNAFEAFEKKYVHQLALCFYNGNCVPENLFEYYIFEYTYNSDGVSMNINSKNRNTDKAMRCSMESVQNQTVMFMRTLSLFVYQNSQVPLPLDFDISLRLYYNEDAPLEYQAPGFEASTGPDPVSDTLRAAVRLGRVGTPHHALVARAFVPGLMPDPEPSDTPPVNTQDDEFRDGSMTCEDSESLEASLVCPCGKIDTHEQALVTCRYCHTHQHAVCFGLMVPVTEHCCAACAATDHTRRPTCPMLTGLTRNTRKQECLCIFRRTLTMCLRQSSITGEELMAKFNLTSTSTAKMISLLISRNILHDTDPRNLTLVRSINPIRLKLACQEFFQEPDSLADRVIAETEAADPVEEALGPIEAITLKETNPGMVVDKPGTINKNTPLKEFSEVELPNQDTSEELPLSGSHNPVRDVLRKEKEGGRKRKKADDDDWTPKLPKLRSGATKNKRA
ncbi:uncharacterized protein LOC134803650 [Cydia splendana]|uniref:uncharacterized protein LOC134803650 n=1 Tax=Cydia splendana TaxID=1100963 RepID=UPI00300C7120